MLQHVVLFRQATGQSEPEDRGAENGSGHLCVNSEACFLSGHLLRLAPLCI